MNLLYPTSLLSKLVAIGFLINLNFQVLHASVLSEALDQPELEVETSGTVLPKVQSNVRIEGDEAIELGPVPSGNGNTSQVTITLTGPALVSWFEKGAVYASGISFTQYNWSFPELHTITNLDGGWRKHETFLDRGIEFEITWTVLGGQNIDSVGYIDGLSVDYRPLIQTQPRYKSSFSEIAATLRVGMYNDVSGLSFQWRRNGMYVSGANEDTLNLDLLSDEYIGDSFDVLVSNEYGEIVSSSVTVPNLGEIAKNYHPSAHDIRLEYLSVEGGIDDMDGPSFTYNEVDLSRGELSMVVDIDGPFKVRDRKPNSVFSFNFESTSVETGEPVHIAEVDGVGPVQLTWKPESNWYYGGFDDGAEYGAQVQAGLIEIDLDKIEIIRVLDEGAEVLDTVVWESDDYELAPNISLDGDLSYQWFYSPQEHVEVYVPVEGATSANILLSEGEQTRSGWYRLRVVKGDEIYESEQYRVLFPYDDSDGDGTIDIVELGLNGHLFSNDSPLLFKPVVYTETIYGEENRNVDVMYWWSNYNPWDERDYCDCDVVFEGSFDLVAWEELESYSLYNLVELSERERIGYRMNRENVDELVPFVRMRLVANP